jgi:hypothetical protein
MKDPRRLLEGDGTQEQQTLLRAAAVEEPPPGGEERLLAALGIGAPLAAPQAAQAGDGADASAPEAATTDGMASATMTGSGLGAMGATKLALVALGGAVLVGSGLLLWSPGDAPGHGSGADAHESSGAGAGESLSAQEDTAGATATTKGSVGGEIAALERARSQLARADGRGALTTLRRYARSYPGGVLAHEADVLRVEALLLAGDGAEALELAEGLLERHGDSPHRARLEDLARRARAGSAP